MKSLEERRADRERRKRLNSRETSPEKQDLKPQDQLDYEDMTVPELRELAKSRGVEVEGTKKADYVSALETSDKGTEDNTTPDQRPSNGIPPVQPWGGK